MLRLLPRWLCFLAVCSAPGVAGTICVTDTLANYQALGLGGCQIGGLTVKDFSYDFVSGTVTIPASSITVTPSTVGDTLGLTFSSAQFNLTGSASSVYRLAYTWDPGDIRSLEDILNNDPTVSPGLARITTLDCEDAAFSPTCLTTTDTLVVLDDGSHPILTDSVSFLPPVGTLGIQNTIELHANTSGIAEFTSIENEITIPEPSTVAPCLLVALLMLRRLRFERF
jgi:hypothetical protein